MTGPGPDEPRRVLLIDDSDIVLEASGSVLTNAGFEVRAVSSLQRFLNALLDWKPHVVVTDLYMPSMTGLELCQWIRHQMPDQRIPIIVFSSAPEAELQAVVREAGADGFICKQAGVSVLPSRLRELCDNIVW